MFVRGLLYPEESRLIAVFYCHGMAQARSIKNSFAAPTAATFPNVDRAISGPVAALFKHTINKQSGSTGYASNGT